jgi:O-antigen/teichoic acid export membrane protein
MNFLFSADTLLAKHYLAADSAGIYASASVLARVIYFLALAVAGVMFPEVAALHARDEAHFHVVDLSLLLVGVMGVALIGAYFLFPGLVLLPYGASFAPAKSYLGVFAVALTLLALSNLLINYFLSIARRSFIIPLFGACILETVLIVLFHSSIGQILTMVVLTVGLMFAVVGLLYATDRFQWRNAHD